MRNEGRGRAFSVELDSKEQLTLLQIPNGSGDKVLFEGIIGELREIVLTEGILFEVRGSKGVLRMEINENEVKKLLQKETRTSEGTK
jgi:hypothetical protein